MGRPQETEGKGLRNKESGHTWDSERIFFLLREKHLYTMLIITQLFLKKNNLVLLYVFKEELSNLD